MKDCKGQIDRRSFLSTCASSVGVFTLSGTTGPLIKTSRNLSLKKKRKKLFATTDFYDNVILHDAFYDKSQLDDMHKELATLGVTRHLWIYDTIWPFYEEYYHGFDLLAEAVKSAHKHGLEIYAVIKPFEGGAVEHILPHSMPCPEGLAFKDLRGIWPWARPSLARRPDMCLKRKPGTYEYRGPVKAIRLVKDNDAPTRVKEEHLSIWTSATNNHFKPYKGSVTFRETVEWRPSFPVLCQCRILHLENLKLPEDHKYILIRCSIADEQGDFTNQIGQMIELIGPDGEPIPFTPGKRPAFLEAHNESFYQSESMKYFMRYLHHPDVKREMADSKKMQMHYRDFFDFAEFNLTNIKTLDSDEPVKFRLHNIPYEYRLRNPETNKPEGYIVVACGKPEYMLGNPHPIYPQIRQHWLEMTKYCLDRGVDGINFRVAQHTRMRDYWDYGYNDPVLKAAGGRTDHITISKINGDTYTQFLREAKELIKSRDKGMTLHLHATMLMADNRKKRAIVLPPNFEWQWETWIREIADDFEYRGSFLMRPENNQLIMDTFSHATRKANRPLFYQTANKQSLDQGRLHKKSLEAEMVNQHPGFDGMVLYETAAFMDKDDEGKIFVKPFMKEVIQKHYWK